MKDDTTHKIFLAGLKKSRIPVLIAAYWLNERGNDVTIMASTEAENPDEWAKHADNGDLYITGKGRNNDRIEVKGLSIDFTCRQDWPYKPHFFICAKHSFDNADPKPEAYLILNNARTHLGIVTVDQYSDWYVQKRKDGRMKNYEQDFYIIDISKVKFTKI